MNKIEYITGYCPKQEAETDIKIEYSGFHVLGDTEEKYKKVSFTCEYALDNECEYCSKCPLFFNS